MKYRKDLKNGNELSILGLGCMRFPRNFGQIDYKKSEKIVLEALEKGINYFDTAYLYMGSEQILGEIVEKNNLREKMYIATKLPFGKCKEYDDFDRLFEEQLKSLRTTYIDYYLIHNMGDISQWKALFNLGIEKWIARKKESGQIKQIGFSFHGLKDMFPVLVDAYEWDFCQIQYNYLNINYQAGRSGLEYAYAKGLSVIIMEPLLGGKLATNLPKEVISNFKELDPKMSPAQLALKWLFNHKEVTVVLSGMNEEMQLIENTDVASDSSENMLTEKELEIYDKVIDVFNKLYKVDCTGCNYCMPCPCNVNIPGCFSAYNYSYVLGRVSGYVHYTIGTKILTDDVNYAASNCVGCKLCEKKCPQNIKIASEMKNVVKRMETKPLKLAVKIVKASRRTKIKDAK